MKEKTKKLIYVFFILAIIGFISIVYLSISSSLIEKAKSELRALR